jgi:predicted RNA-binding Zn-ribbon protein involved in translation (DUF1610 family)
VSPDETCGVCGRSILAGERTRTFMSPKEGQKLVCELCRERAGTLGWVDPAAPGANVGKARPEPVAEAPHNRLERAVFRFNASEAARTVAGLTRSLGSPWVSVGAMAGSPSEVRITVAWELSWYQWGVDLADEGRPVFPIDKGSEIEQLDRPARQWNASAGEGGALSIGAPPVGRKRDGEPVG